MKPIKIKDYSVSQEEFQLVYNSKYDLYKTDPIPSILDKYYESENYISHTDSKKNRIDKLYQLVKKVTLQQKASLLDKLVKTNNRFVLDIGCGTGSFLETLKNKNWNVVGVEPNFKARQLAKEKNISSFSETNEIKNKKFNIITMWHVLEHVPNLDQQFLEIKRLLAKKGIVIIAVPNFKSWDAQFYKEFWAAYDVPRHIWHFSQKGITQLAFEHQLELIETKPMWFDSFYVSLLSEKYKNKKINYFKVFGIGLLSNIKALKNNEFSSKIYIFKKK